MISSASQSLFQIYYLGEVAVDGRLSKSVLPWITEEKKLMAEGMRFIWLTPGTDGLSYVADNGQEIFRHPYSSIVQSAKSNDGISFAYISHREKDGKHYCHMFQALTYEEATLIMKKIKSNTIGLLSAQSTSTTEEHHKAQKVSSTRRKKLSCDYSIDFLGKTETQSPASTKESQVQVLDNAVRALKEKNALQGGLAHKQHRNIGSKIKSRMIRRTNKSSVVDVNTLSRIADEDTAKKESDGVAITLSRASESPEEMHREDSTSLNETGGEALREIGKQSSMEDKEPSSSSVTNAKAIEKQSSTEDEDITTSKVTVSVQISGLEGEEQMEIEEHRKASPISQEDKQSASKRDPTGISTPNSDSVDPPSFNSTEDGSDHDKTQNMNNGQDDSPAMNPSISSISTSSSLEGGLGTQDHHQAGRNGDAKMALLLLKEPDTIEEEKKVSESSDFDTIPELENLQTSAEFKALSQKSLELPSRRVKLVFSGLTLSVLSDSGQQLFKRKIKTIACCAQGRKWSDYVSFTCREGEEKPRRFYLYIFRAESTKYANMILDSFKACFAHALSFSTPVALCEFCPLLKFHDLCQSLEGISTQVAQSRIHDCLGTFNEADYKKVMRQLKASQHADHEFTEIVILVSLLRAHYQKLQEQHSHSTSSAPSVAKKPPASSAAATAATTATQDDSKTRLRVPAFMRAKNAITSSFENLRSERKYTWKTKKWATVDSESETGGDQSKKPEVDKATQSLTLPPTSGSSFFARKVTSPVQTLAAPPSSMVEGDSDSEGKKDGEIKRERSWSASFRLRRPKSPRSTETADNEESTKKNEAESITTPTSTTTTTTEDAVARKKKTTEDARTMSPTPPTSRPLSPVLGTQQSPSEELQTPTRLIWKHKSARPDRRRRKTSPRPETPTDNNFILKYPKGFTPGHRRSTSWMQEIFDSINTPKKDKSEKFSKESMEFLDDFEVIEPPFIDQLRGTRERPRGEDSTGHQSPHTRAQKRWKDAIDQQIILNRMDRTNKQFKKEVTEAELKRLKLCYHDPTLDLVEANKVWNDIMAQPDPKREDIHQALLIGVPPGKRGEVWSHLASLYQARRKTDSDLFECSDDYETLRQGSTEYEHSISVDLGRTFPSHPYFSGQFKHLGQEALYNVLHAYAVADPEIGYCQGLSFVVGMIIMHMKDEESAFSILHQFMILYNYRELYLPALSNLQMRLYQFSRLMNELTPAMFHHLAQCEVTPFFYAAPWFLTVFASQYPIAFTARVLDLFFYEGPDIIFKVGLSMMKFHHEGVLRCNSMESTSYYLKSQLPETILEHMPTVFKNALDMSLENRLLSFETEYEMMEELTSSFRMDLSMTDIESVNEVMKQQNTALREQLAICHGSIRSLDTMMGTMQQQLSKQQEVMEAQQQQIEKQQQTIMRLDELFSSFQIQRQEPSVPQSDNT